LAPRGPGPLFPLSPCLCKRSDVTHEPLDEKCPECGSQLSIRLGRHGRFVGCTNYPECKYTRDLNTEGKTADEPEMVPDRKCPQCGSDLLIKNGRYGKFIGCSAYPKCRFIEPLEKPSDTGVTCPQCHRGSLLQRKSRRGKVFFSCSTYPACDYAVWNQPIAEPCPQCAWPILTIKTTRGGEIRKVCPQKECGYAEAAQAVEEG